jgi:hypothetical protein
VSQCSNPEYEHMLHAFELGLLAEEDRLHFEEHLLDCDYCFARVEEFMAISHRMRHDPDVRPDPEEVKNLLSGTAGKQEVEDTSVKNWSRFTRLVAIAAMVIVAALPVYWLGFRETATDGPIQQINLMPTRGGSPPVLYLDEGGTAEIRFVAEGIQSGTGMKVRIVGRTGGVIYETDYDEAVDASGNGNISLPITEFEPGFYKLIFFQPHDTTQASQREYNFRVR